MENFRHLVERAKSGDKEALLTLIMSKKEDYYKLSFVYMKNEAEALDALEDMIVILYEKIKTLKDSDAFYSWSKTILVNCCRKNLRKNKKVVILEKIKEVKYIEKYEQKEQKVDIHKVLNLLNNKQKESIIFKYFLDYDYESIAEIMKVPVGTVKSRISTGLKKLKKYLRGEY